MNMGLEFRPRLSVAVALFVFLAAALAFAGTAEQDEFRSFGA